MKILFLGGTRFLGLSLLIKLSKIGFDLTVLSRRKVENMSGVAFLQGEKNDVLSELKGIHFDVVIDFISYGLDDVELNQKTLTFGRYYFISSVWLNKIAPSHAADEYITTINDEKFESLPKVTQRYLIGKLNAEKFIFEKSQSEKKYNIVRLPIFLGSKDHTKRIHYYIERVIDEHDILLLNNGYYEAQIDWEKDIARLLERFIEAGGSDYLIWEALPSKAVSIRDIFIYLEETLGKRNNLISKDLDFYKEHFPEYLRNEPLWREEKIEVTSHNLFSEFSTESTDYKFWIKKIANEIMSNDEIESTPFRKKEVEFIRNYL